jgi:PAS domain S-box-containing protein
MPRSSLPPAPTADAPDALRVASATAKVGLWDWDLVTNEVKWTDVVYLIHGVERAKFPVTFDSFVSLVHPDDRARVQAAIGRALQADQPYELEFRIVRPGGKTAWVFTNGTVIRQDGRPIRMIGATLDVTASRRADDDTLRLAAIVESSDDAITSQDLSGIITSWNGGAQRLFGYAADEIIGRPSTVLLPAGRQDEEPSILERVRRGEKIESYETIRRRKDGTLVDVSLKVSPLRDATGRVLGASKIIRDITERLRTQRESAWLAAIVTSAEEAILSKDLTGLITSWNAGAEHIFGYTADEAIGRPVTMLIPADRQNEEPAILDKIRRGEKIQHYETIRRHRDGHLLHVALTVSPIRDARGVVVGASKIARDISARKRTEEALRVSEDRFRLLARHAPVGIFLSAENGDCVFVNQRWCDMTGMDANAAAGDGWSRAIHPADREAVLAGWADAVRENQPCEAEFRFLRPDGTVVWVQASAVRFKDGDHFRGYLGTCVDITVRKQAELQARFLQELSERVIGLSDPDAILRAAQSALGEHLGADRCYFYELFPGEGLALVRGDWSRTEQPSTQGRHRLGDFGVPEFATLLAQPRLVIPDLATHALTREHLAGYRALGMGSLATTTLAKDNRRLSLAVSTTKPRAWTAQEMDLVANVMQRVWPAIERAEAEQALRASEQLYRAIGDSINYGVWVCDAEGRNLYASDSFLKLVGHTQEQCANLGWTDLLHPDDVADTTRAWLRCVRSGDFWEREHRFRGADGQFHPVLARGVPIRDAAGKIVRWVGINLDISAMNAARATAEQRMEALELSEARLRDSENRWRQLAEAMPHLVWTCRADGACDYLSPQWVAYTGMPEAEQLGDGWSRAVHPEDLGALQEKWARAVREGSVFDTEFRIRRADGVYRWFKARALPVRDDAGHIIKWYGTNTDIEEFRRIEQAIRKSEHQLRLVTDHAPVFLVQTDTEHRFKFVNRSYAERYGLTREDIIGRRIAELTGEEAWASFRPQVEAALAGRRIEFEQEIPYRTLGRRWVHVIYEPERSPEGAVVGIVAVIVDITVRKQAEIELAAARDEALAASRAKDDFLATLSHELRTPLNPVLLLASDAANNASLPREIRETFELIRTNVSLEARLIDDLLDLTYITRGKMSLDKQVLDVHDVLRDAVGNLRADIEARRLGLELELAAPHSLIVGDAVRLQQVFWNILKNAVKFTPEEGRIRVRTTAAAGPDRILVEITDTGIGLSPEELARVFEAFAQGEHATSTGSRRYGGLGLGLAISHRLVELHAGRITATSEGRNRGARFVVELPLSTASRAGDAPALPAGNRLPAAGAAPAGEILLVEDHASTRETLQKLLTRRNFTVTPASSAGEARHLAGSRRFDFLVSDVGLPDADGYQLMNELRILQPGIQGIAISGYGMEDDIQRSQAAGFSSHLVKPVSITALENALAALKRPAAPA